MIKISNFSSKMEAQMVADALSQQGIRAEVFGAKEYSSHLLGTDFGAFELWVEPDSVAAAQRILQMSVLSEVSQEVVAANPKFYFKKAMIFAILAMIMLPVIFNYVSLRNLWLFRAVEQNPRKKLMITVFILSMQLPTVAMLFFLYRSRR